jgi:hypothetical protein
MRQRLGGAGRRLSFATKLCKTGSFPLGLPLPRNPAFGRSFVAMIRVAPPALLVLLPFVAAALAAQEPIRAPLQTQVPELAEQSTLGMDFDANGLEPRRRGAFPVGNGRMFTHIGPGTPVNTMLAISGPTYQADEHHRPDGDFGNWTFEVLAGDAPVDWQTSRVRRVRGAAFVVTEQTSADGLALRTTTFAVHDRAQIVRVVELQNGGSAARSGLRLRAQASVAAKAGDGALTAQRGGQRQATATFRLHDGRADGNALVANVPELAAGQSWSTVASITAAPAGPAEAAPAPTLDAAAELATKTLADWAQRVGGAFKIDTDQHRVRDLVADWPVTMLTMQCATSGLVVPMAFGRYVKPRDGVGPMLSFLRLNLWDDAKKQLRYWFDATRLLGRVPTEVPTDLDFGALAGTSTDWSKVAVPPGDAALWIILLHHWYFRVTQDVDTIQQHWPLIDLCLKRVPRGQDSMLTFSGDEPYLGGGLHRLFPNRVTEADQLVAHAADADRSAYSLGNGVLFLLSIQAVGELVDGIDRKTFPQKYEGEGPSERVSKPYTERSFGIMSQIEKRFWLDSHQHFAPAISPLNGLSHEVPLANLNLMPLWAGWTFPSGEKSRDNLRNTLKVLWQRGARIGSTPSCGYVTGDVQGMLLHALCDRDAKERMDAFDEVLAMAGPAGEWASLYGPDGYPSGIADEARPERLDPRVGGINFDALMFGMNGMRFVSTPNWDNVDIRAKLRLPRGATFATMRNLKKDGRTLNVYMRETTEELSEVEKEDNRKKETKDQRDESIPHRRFSFRMELVSGKPKKGTYYDVAVNAAQTMFVRYLWHANDVVDGANVDRRIIDEREFWKDEHEPFFPTGSLEPAKPYQQLPLPADIDTVFLGARQSAAEWVAGEKTVVVDLGLPYRIRNLATQLGAGFLSKSGARLVLDHGFDRVDGATLKSKAFFADPSWTELIGRFEKAGGIVVSTNFLGAAASSGTKLATAADGAIVVPAAAAERVVTLAVRSETDQDAVLRTGSRSALSVTFAGIKSIDRTTDGTGMPDQDAALVKLKAGTNQIELRLPAGGEQPVYVRVTDQRGLPLTGVGQE